MQSARIWLDDVLVLSFWGGMPYREWKTKKSFGDGESEYPANTEQFDRIDAPGAADSTTR